jgi:hypothetical protein
MVLNTDYILYDNVGVPSQITSSISGSTVTISPGVELTESEYVMEPTKIALLESIDYFMVDPVSVGNFNRGIWVMGKEAVSKNQKAFNVEFNGLPITTETKGRDVKKDIILTTSSVTGTTLTLKYFLLSYDSKNKALSVIPLSAPFLVYNKETVTHSESTSNSIMGIKKESFTISSIDQATSSSYYVMGYGYKSVTAELSALAKIEDIVFTGPDVTNYMVPVTEVTSTVFELIPDEPPTYYQIGKSRQVAGWDSQPIYLDTGTVTVNNNIPVIFVPLVMMIKTGGTTSGGNDQISINSHRGGWHTVETTETFSFDGATTIYIVGGIVAFLVIIAIMIMAFIY